MFPVEIPFNLLARDRAASMRGVARLPRRTRALTRGVRISIHLNAAALQRYVLGGT